MTDEQTLDVPEAVLGKARALGPAGQRWLEGLPDLLHTLERAWGLTLGPILPGGSAACVVGVITAEGTPAILKVHLPGYDDLTTEARVLRIAAGRGYARLLRADEPRGVLLLERLGSPLSELGFPLNIQLKIICATLEQAWVTTPEAAGFPSGAEKARWLGTFIEKMWETLGRPCSQRVIQRALACCAARDAAFDPANAVLAHGDGHAANTLAPFGAAPNTTTGFRFIDPDGLFAERAYDLGILMRGWSADLLAGDALQRGRERCSTLHRLTGEDPDAIWQWGFIERVSTGLLLLHTGGEAEGRDFLRVAEAWARG